MKVTADLHAASIEAVFIPVIADFPNRAAGDLIIVDSGI